MLRFWALALVLLCPEVAGASWPNVWPKPWHEASANATLLICPNRFEFECCACETSALLSAAILRYQKLLFLWGEGAACNASQSLTDIAVEVKDLSEDLQFGVDESYELTVDAKGFGSLVSKTIWGAIRGLDSFAQLVSWDGDQQLYSVAAGEVNDAPAYPYRGILLDTARHFLPVSALLRTLDGMAYNKLNTLHWHATDAESMPVESTKFPKLARMGAFLPSATYSAADVRRVVEYGRQRAIRVLVEFDMPGHNYAYGIGYPDLLNNCSQMYPLATEFWAASFNPVRESTYSFVESFLGEMVELFPDHVLHLGGDEVVEACWNESTEIHDFMKKENMTDLGEVFTYFETRVHAIARKLNRTVQSWDEVFVNARSALPDDAIVHVYRGQDTLNAAVEAGYRGVLSSGFYLNTGFDMGGAETQWKDIYVSNITDTKLSPEQAQRVIGAEACMWGETADDFNLDQRLWLRAAAFAERVWSRNRDVADLDAVSVRLIEQRCRLLQHGLRPSPYDNRDVFPRRSVVEQCELILPPTLATWRAL